MPIFWGNRNRHDRHDPQTHISTSGTRVITADGGRYHDGGRHHDHQTHITTSGTRVINADGGRYHDGGRHHDHHTVVAVPATNISTHVSGTDRRRRHRRSREPSTIHGLWTKILGTLTRNRSKRRRGEREMRKARQQRQALRIARQAGKVRDTGRMNKLRKFHSRRHRKRSRAHSDNPAIIVQDGGHRRKTPWGHYGSRALPSYHGAHHRLFGFLTRQRDRHAQGKAMAIAAEEDRRRERRRRREEMMDQGRRYRERGRL